MLHSECSASFVEVALFLPTVGFGRVSTHTLAHAGRVWGCGTWEIFWAFPRAETTGITGFFRNCNDEARRRLGHRCWVDGYWGPKFYWGNCRGK